MKNLLLTGRAFFGLGLIGFGLLHFLAGDFLAGRAPAWPENLPGQLAWAWLSGCFLILAGAAIVFGKFVRPTVYLAAAVLFAWAFLRLVPVAWAATPFGGEWTTLGKALVLSTGSFVFAATFTPNPAQLERCALATARWSLALFLAFCGSQHFIWAEFAATLVPTWLPGATAWTYFTGAALIAGGLGMTLPKTARLAALLSGLMILAWVVLLHAPRALEHFSENRFNEALSLFEATAFAGLAFVLAARLPQKSEPV